MTRSYTLPLTEACDLDICKTSDLSDQVIAQIYALKKSDLQMKQIAAILFSTHWSSVMEPVDSSDSNVSDDDMVCFFDFSAVNHGLGSNWHFTMAEQQLLVFLGFLWVRISWPPS